MSDPELDAVEAALNTLALAETESALQKVVSRLLPALLTALSTKSTAARAKCIETLSHINVRIRSVPSITLPFKEVLNVAIDPSASVLTQNVTIAGGYLTRCFDRLSSSNKAAALTDLIRAADAISSHSNKNTLQFLVMRSLASASAEVPHSSGEELWNLVHECPESAIFSFFEYSLLALRQKLAVEVPEVMLLAVVRLASEYAGIQAPNRAVKVFLHFLVAAGTANRTQLNTAGEDALKRVDTCDVLVATDPGLIYNLFAYFVDPLADLSLRMILMSKGLLRVTLCASYFPEVLDVIELVLFKPGIPPRFISLGMQFVSFVISNSELDPLKSNVSRFASLMLKLVRNETNGSPSFPDAVRGFGYVALADLVVRIPSLMGLYGVSAQLFFSAAQIKEGPPDVRSCASQALMTMTRVISFPKGDASNNRKLVLGSLLDAVRIDDDDLTSVRVAAVKWANECFSYADCDARLVNFIAAGDIRPDVRQHALEGLSSKRWPRKDGRKERMPHETLEVPDFCQLVHTYSTCQHRLSRPKSIAAYLKFGLLTLKHTIVPGGRMELSFVDHLDRFFESYQPFKTSLLQLKKVADEALFSKGGSLNGDLERSALSVVLFTLKVKSLRGIVSQAYVKSIEELVLLASRKLAVADFVAARAISALIGISSGCLITQKLEELVAQLGEGLQPNPSGVASGRHGEDDRAAKLLSLGQVIAYGLSRNAITWKEDEKSPVSQACLNIMRRVTLPVESCDVVRVSACSALAVIGAGGTLPLSMGSRKMVTGILVGVLKLHSSSPRVVQAAAEALGKICVGEPLVSFRYAATDGLLFICKERKEEDIRFTASESLVRCASGFDAPSPAALEESDSRSTSTSIVLESEELQSILDIRIDAFEVREVVMDDDAEMKGAANLDEIVREVIKLTLDERPNARAGGCVALFTFLRLLGSKRDGPNIFHSKEDEARFKNQQDLLLHILPEIQQAFVVLLGDRSDFVQHLSSCGVALAYEMCPMEGQRDLVSTLVKSLTAGKHRAASIVPGDKGTLLELGGVHVKDGPGGARSATYKELCSLAEGMGQPEMVYKFMDLAGHTALWNSRRGAALAGSALLESELAAEQLRPHVNSLIPRLYVYCYDPTDSVKVAMGSVILAVVKASGLGSISEAITAHFSSVIQYCLKSISSRQWRVREAACGALRDALVSRSWKEVKDDLKMFWYYVFRAMDDIKESVRKVAEGTGRALSELSVHLCDPGRVSVEVASGAVAIVIPCVLPAFTHRVEEVRLLATKTMSEIIRFGGEALKPSVPDLISNLLEAATELEPQVLNYAQFHVDSPEELQNARVNAAATSASPLIDSLERLSGLVDESNISQLIPKLTRLARLGVGIPTRAVTARLFSSLLQSRASVMEKFAPKLMFSAASAAEMERNPTLRGAWCGAAGMAAKLSSTEDVGKYIDQIVVYSGSENAQERAVASSLALGIWKKGLDTAHKHATAILPIAYMGGHETDEIAKGAGSNWREVWSEGAPSTEAGLRLYAKEITHICQTRLSTSSQYRVKRSAAAALGALAKASNETIDVKYIRKAANALLATIPGHIWEGKVVVIEALGEIAHAYSSLEVWNEVGGADVVVRTLMLEAQRGNKDYRMSAIGSATKLLNRCHDEFDMYDDVKNNLSQFWNGEEKVEEGGSNMSRVIWETGSDADAVNARNKARKAQKLLCVGAVSCLEAAYPSEKKGGRQATQIGDVIKVIRSVVEGDWDVRLGVLKALQRAVERTEGGVLISEYDCEKSNLICSISRLAGIGIMDGKYAALRRCGYAIMLALGKQLDDKSKVKTCLTDNVRSWIVASQENDSDPGGQADAKKVCAVFGLT